MEAVRSGRGRTDKCLVVATHKGEEQTSRMTKKFGLYFLVEVLVIFMVGAAFSLIENKLHAGAIAGSLFVLLGLWIVAPGLKNAEYRKRPTFFAGLLHLFGSALPLLISRFAQADLKFEDVRVMGLTGPQFHQVSNVIYMILMAATAFDWFRSRAKHK